MEELSRTRKVPLCISSPRSIRAVLHLTRALVPSSMMQRALTEGPHCAISAPRNPHRDTGEAVTPLHGRRPRRTSPPAFAPPCLKPCPLSPAEPGAVGVHPAWGAADRLPPTLPLPQPTSPPTAAFLAATRRGTCPAPAPDGGPPGSHGRQDPRVTYGPAQSGQQAYGGRRGGGGATGQLRLRLLLQQQPRARGCTRPPCPTCHPTGWLSRHPLTAASLCLSPFQPTAPQPLHEGAGPHFLPLIPMSQMHALSSGGGHSRKGTEWGLPGAECYVPHTRQPELPAPINDTITSSRQPSVGQVSTPPASWVLLTPDSTSPMQATPCNLSGYL